ncbi:MAG: SpoIIE family protein phosphatase [Thermoguttaceae bacterium]|nr:SpoIIE family protein phosphatase [Thermoguttaceae bacterium]MDW8078666.1 SpoIIE family protein phosphatase [Thermoguttaceae bacterium]
MAILRVLRGLNTGQTYPLNRDSVVLGRNPNCDIVLPLPAVSRYHARIFRRGDDYYVEDLNSRNKTYLNDNVVEYPSKLSENDRIRICDVEFVFQAGEEGEVARVPERPLISRTPILEDELPTSSSTVMSTLDIASTYSPARVVVNPAAKLKALIAISQSLARAVTLDEVLPKVLDALFVIFPQAERGFILLRDRESGKFVPRAVKQRRERAHQSLRLSRTILQQVVEKKEAILSADATRDARFDMAQSVVDFQIHSVMCAPLLGSEGEVLGVIQLDTSDQLARFTEDDLEVLASVACQAAIAVENAQLHEIALEQAEIRRELANAQRLQQGFLPAAPPEIPGYAFFDFYDPAKELGGDYFAYVRLAERRYAIVVADVSGKGFSASLLVARLSAETPQLLLTEQDPVVALGRLNEVFCESRWEDRFVTMVAVVLNADRHEIEVVSAGHPPAIIRRRGGTLVRAGEKFIGLPLGVLPGFRYQSEKIPLSNFDSVILYTDGITEAMNERNEVYGFDRLEAFLKKAPPHVEQLGESLIADVRRFVGTRAQSDDMCLVCFGREE